MDQRDNRPRPRARVPLASCALLAGLAGGCDSAGAQPAGDIPAAQSPAVEFDPAFLPAGFGGGIDLSRFSKGSSVLPGTYNVDAYVNDDWVGRVSVPFMASPGSPDSAQPCFDAKLLARLGISIHKLPIDTGPRLEAAGGCLPLPDLIDMAAATFQLNEQRLYLSVPQSVLDRMSRGYVSPDQWNSGVNGGVLGYDLNAYRYTGGFSSSYTSYYAGINAGFNAGEWRFRHAGSALGSSVGSSSYNTISTYGQRDVTMWNAQLTLGDAFTSGDLFDSVAFRGVRVASDDRMLPDSMRGYAPRIAGVANTNARVRVTQNGIVLYQTNVAPGAFEIDDLYPTGFGGDLLVEVLESDGRRSSFVVPFAAVPLALRPGGNRFSITAGVVRDPSLHRKPEYLEATWQHGFTNVFTGYGGVTTANSTYAAAILGGAFNTSIGAIGVDVTQAAAQIPNSPDFNGTSARVSFSKLVTETDTNFALATYRYSTSGFLSLTDAMYATESALRAPDGQNRVIRPRSRTQATISQAFGSGGGVLNLNASSVNYWNRGGSDINYAIGYTNSLGRVSYNLSANRQRDWNGRMETILFANISIPIGRTNPATLSSSVTRESSGRNSVQAALSANLGEQNEFSYGLNVNRSSGGDRHARDITTTGGNVTYRASSAQLSAGASQGGGFSQASVGIRGAIVAHPGGVTLSQPVGDTIAVLNAEGADGARVVSSPGASVDGRGYAVVPYLTPYRINTVQLDPKGLDTDVELKETSQQFAPRAGSIMMLKFETDIGRSAFIRVERAGGEAPPFGAAVMDEDGRQIGTVGQAGRVFARGLKDTGTATITWGTDGTTSCRMDYALPPPQKKSADKLLYQQISATCLAVAASNPHSNPQSKGSP
ncbi:Outer membrane usher protein HtrE precursor [compost metagenome]